MKVSVNYCSGCTISIDCELSKFYKVLVTDGKNTLYEEYTNSKIIKLKEITPTENFSFINYNISIFDGEELIFHEKINLTGKKVKINIDSTALGDNLAWIPHIDRFQKIHQCDVYVNCPKKELFQDCYPNLSFNDASSIDSNSECMISGLQNFSCKNFYCFYDNCKCYYASYDLGYYSTLPELRTLSLGQVATKLLGIPYIETKPKIKIANFKKNHHKPYVCIAVHSTAQYKYWNNSIGWQQVVDFLIKIGYDVICIDQNHTISKDGFINTIPQRVIDKTGNIDLQERINDIKNCEFFIGLSSGLSWLAWSLDKPVIMISGFTNPNSEFVNEYRVHNSSVCNSCWNNTDLVIEKKWDFCVLNKNYECSKEITAFDVIKQIKKLNKVNT